MSQSSPALGPRPGRVLPFMLAVLIGWTAPAVRAETSIWQRAAYYDADYPSAWVSGTTIRDALAAAGYEILNAAGGAWDVNQTVTLTAQGTTWGLQQTWTSQRPALPSGPRVLGQDANNNAAGWVRHYDPKDAFRGFVRFFDRPGTPPAPPVVPTSDSDGDGDVDQAIERCPAGRCR